ncbi:MAG TPA: SDR family NAD(P)-dependent oxidoreductase, partial [Solirubrobacteraceae bacterium]|nr:SDR family NAD(P)-dependent oxidoreductase [Solirubrobacteraceae bacterium]
MNIDLSGRTALVTGSTAGIGQAIATGLARAGATVIVNGRSEERTRAAAEQV